MEKYFTSIPLKSLIVLILIHNGTCCLKSNSENVVYDSMTPTPRKDSWWLTLHEGFVAYSKLQPEDNYNTKILFLGDSITQGWLTEGNSTFHKYYDKYVAVNYGISADRTQHLLWRVKNGEVDHIKPQLIILLIGTNNLGFNKDIEVFKGIKAIVQELRKRLYRSKIMLLGILPRNNVNMTTQRVNPINKLVMQLDDGVMVWYFDLGRYFFIEDRLLAELYQPDLLHLSSKGYETWALAMHPVLKEMLELVFEPE